MIFSSGVVDQRRKLDDADYARIQFQYNFGYTIRQIANEHGISTKFVHKLLTNTVTYDYTEPDYLHPDICSGCGRKFDYSGLTTHFAFWTSGGNPLACMGFMPH